MIDETRQLRWYGGLGLIFLAVMPILGMALVATDPGAANNELLPVLIGGPINAVGAVLVIRSMLSRDPAASARLLAVGGGLIVVGDVLLFALRAAVT
jgi:hypothetical protein